MAVAVNLKLPAAMLALQAIDGFALHQMQMPVPPLLAADIGAEPLLFPTCELLDGLATALATAEIGLWLFRHHLDAVPAAKVFYGVFRPAQCLSDFLVTLALGSEVFDGLLFFVVSVKVVSKRLGHTNIQTTLDLYVHYLPSMDLEVSKIIGSEFVL